MTGLDIDKDHIIEMACIITDPDLNIIAEVGDLHPFGSLERISKGVLLQTLIF